MPSESSLRALMNRSFNKEELKDICFDLGIDFENMPENKNGLLREMIIACERSGMVGLLLEECRRQRPNVTWPEATRSLFLEELLGEETESLPYEPELVSVAAGSFLMGSTAHGDAPSAEQPQHEVYLAYYRIGRFPVTIAQYAAFIKAEPTQAHPIKAGWFLRQPPDGKLEHPVTGVTWYDAQAYCQWLSELSGRLYRLPTEAEWEKAARGTDGFVYSWGNKWQEGRCNGLSDETTPVSAYPLGESPFGCLDMLGNVQEWTSTLWGDNRRQPSFTYPYSPTDGREFPNDDPQRPRLRRIHRGGSFSSELAELRCAFRGHDRPSSTSAGRGFRVVFAPASSPK